MLAEPFGSIFLKGKVSSYIAQYPVFRPGRPVQWKPSQLVWEAASRAVINASTQISIDVYSQVLNPIT